MKQHQKLLLGFVLGIVGGLAAFYLLPTETFPFMKGVTDVFTLVGAVFLRLIFMVVIPLLVSALMLGVFELGQGKGLGKVASKSIIFTLALSFMAVIIAIGLTTLLQPGVGLKFDPAALHSNTGVIKIADDVKAVAGKEWYQYIVDLLPQNPIDAAARAFQGEIVSLMFFALIFGYALSLTVKNKENPLIQSLDAIFQASMKVIDFAMKLAPFGIFGIVFNTTYRMGASFLGNVAFYAMTVILGLLIQQFIVYGTFLKVFAKVSPWAYFKQCKDVYLYAFTTASSNATLPVALETAEDILKIPSKISRFVLTIGATANQNGTALFEGVTVLFLAQVYGINLSLGSQVLVVLMSILAGVGTAGVPGGSLPLIMVLLTQVGIPVEGIGLILGVDRLLDMCRTTLNVSGDLVIAKLVSANVNLDELNKEEVPV